MVSRSSRVYLWFLMLGMLLSGTSNTLFAKITDSTVVAGELYTHPFLQTLFMFIGEYLCFIVYFLKKKVVRQQEEEDTINPMWFAIPAFLDLCASSLIFIALTLINASVY